LEVEVRTEDRSSPAEVGLIMATIPAFNPRTDIRVGHFVALSVEQEELYAGVPFYLGKVLEFGKGR
jgi:hypothetical protein